MVPEVEPHRRDAGPTVRTAAPTEYEEIGELTVRAYATVGDPLQGGPTYAAYEHELRDVASRAEACVVLAAIWRAGPAGTASRSTRDHR